MKVAEAIARAFMAFLSLLNRRRQREYTNDPAAAIANDGRVQHSTQTFAELAGQAECDPACGRRGVPGCAECKKAGGAES